MQLLMLTMFILHNGLAYTLTLIHICKMTPLSTAKGCRDTGNVIHIHIHTSTHPPPSLPPSLPHSLTLHITHAHTHKHTSPPPSLPLSLPPSLPHLADRTEPVLFSLGSLAESRTADMKHTSTVVTTKSRWVVNEIDCGHINISMTDHILKN